MGRWKQRRHRPSEVARHRLGDAIRERRAELEVQLAEGLLRTELYLETGQPERAAEVVEEQRRRLLDFDAGLREALAGAAVEAEAEAVIARAARAAVAERLHDREPSPSRFPQLVAASLAAVASFALLTVLGVDRGDDSLRAAVRIDATGSLPSAGLDVSPLAAPSSLRFEGYGSGTSDIARALPRSSVPYQAETGRWLAEQDGILARLGVDVRVRSEVIRELEGLVATLEPGSPLTDEMWLQMLAEAQDIVQRRTEEQPPPAEDDTPPADEDDDQDRRSWIDPRHGAEDGDGGAEDEQASEEDGGSDGPSAPEAPSDGDADGEADGDGADGSSDTPSAPGTDAPDSDGGEADGHDSGGFLAGS